MDAAHILIDTTEQHDLHMTLLEHLPTPQAFMTGNHMRTNNVFTTTDLNDNVTKC